MDIATEEATQHQPQHQDNNSTSTGGQHQQNPGPKQTHLVIFLSDLTSTSHFTALIDLVESEEYLGKPLENEKNIGISCLVPSGKSMNFNSISGKSTEMLDEILVKIISFKADFISLVGVGVGGLIARYLVGLLHEKGVFHLVSPAHFITIDCPHLGTASTNSPITSSTGFASLFSSFSFKGPNHGIDLELALQPSSNDKVPLLLRMAEPYFLIPLKMFQSRTLFSAVHEQDSTSDTTKSATFPRQKSLSRRSSTRKSVKYQTSSITRSEFPPLTTLESASSFPSLILDTREGLVEEPLSLHPSEEEAAEERNNIHTLDVTEIQNEMQKKLEQLDWTRLAIIPGKREIDVHTPDFWSLKQSQPLIKSIITILQSTRQSPISPSTKSLEAISPCHSPPPICNQKDLHLVVLIHGLDGFDTDMEFISNKLKERYKRLYTLPVTCNHGKTYDGILKGATRIYKEVVLEIGRLREVGSNCRYISVIGHSLGGLYGRCFVYLMYQEKLIPQVLVPMTFITLATPHLGSREHSKWVGDKVTSLVLGSFIGLTGSELMLADEGGRDGDPFVVELSKDEYTRPLHDFKRILNYANVRYDVPVHYSTAAIRRTPYHPPVSSNLQERGGGVYPIIHFDSKPEPEPDQDDQSFEARILRNLTKTLKWKRYAVITERPLLAHIDIIIKSAFWNKHGYPIIAHVVDHFRHPPDIRRNSVPEHCTSDTSLNRNSVVDVDTETPPVTPTPCHLVVVLHGAGRNPRDLIHFVESLRDIFPRPRHKIVAPEYPTSNGTGVDDVKEGERLVGVWLVAWAEYQIAHSNVHTISIIGQGSGGVYAVDFIRELYKNMTSSGRQIKFGTFITVDSPLSSLQASFGNDGDMCRALESFTNLALYCCTTDSSVPTISGLLLVENDKEIVDTVDRDEKVWRIVLWDSHQHRQRSVDTMMNSLAASSSSSIAAASPTTNDKQSISSLKWKRFLIVPPKSYSETSFFYWNNEHHNHLIAHISALLF